MNNGLEIENKKVYIDLKNHENDVSLNFENINYTEDSNRKNILTLLEDDGRKWTIAYTQFYKKYYDVDIDVNFTFGWFANAIENTKTIIKNEQNEIENKVDVD